MLECIEEDIKNCQACKNLTKLKFNTVSLGKNQELLFIGESPAKNGWLKTGKAFYDEKNKLLGTGKVLNKLLTILSITIDDITFTEACKCYIPDRKLLKTSSIKCLPFLEKQIVSLPIKILITLGEHPTRILLQDNFKKYADVVGKPYKINILSKELILIPIYHPSPINPKGYKENIIIFNLIKDIIDKSYIV